MSGLPAGWKRRIGRFWIGGSGAGDSRRALFSIVSPDQLVRISATLFDENAFLSPHGLRALSKRHSTPYQVPGMPCATIEYEPAESHTAMYGGNSNWRGPVWFPINYLVIRALLQYDQFFGPEFTIEYPTGSGQRLRCATSPVICRSADQHLASGPDGRRPVYGGVELMQTDPAWKDNLLFYEYFHGDNGAGLGPCIRPVGRPLVADLLLDPPRRTPDDLLRGRGGRDSRTQSPLPSWLAAGIWKPQFMSSKLSQNSLNPISTRSTPGPGWKQSVRPKAGLLILGRSRPLLG